jgi:hypothetical protein
MTRRRQLSQCLQTAGYLSTATRIMKTMPFTQSSCQTRSMANLALTEQLTDLAERVRITQAPFDLTLRFHHATLISGGELVQQNLWG